MNNYFKGFMMEYIERNKNTKADDLAKAAACNIPMSIDVFFSSHRRCLGQNSHAKAQADQYHRRGRLESTYNGIPSPLF
jgi:hypothetical protein